MAIDTVNEKLAVLSFAKIWEPNLPINPGAFDQGEKQQLLWGYPGITWGAPVVVNRPKSVGFMENIASFMNR